ncbi:hypothetical protein ACJMK2_038752 [Sinanodonta woodiana]|uniref:Uncharacterized protein n=1 Tax=Sinanodonta woodiana TaxID=1069815 RepID=A0ABD3WBU9_SINWO
MEPVKEGNYSGDGVRSSKTSDSLDSKSKDSGHTPISSTSDQDLKQQVTNAVTDGNLKTESETKDDSAATVGTKKECGSCGGADCGCAFCDDIYAISSMVGM